MRFTWKSARRVGGWLFMAVLGLVLASFLALVFVPRVMGWESVVVLSGSMEPTLPVGGIVLLDPVHAEELRVGDIVSYYVPGSEGEKPRPRVTHRVVEIEAASSGPLITTKGDANSDADSYAVMPADVISREVWAIPHVGRVSNFLRSRDGFKLMVIGPAIAVVASSLFSIIVEMDRQRRKTAS